MSIIKKQTLYGTLYSYLGVAVGAITQAYLFPHYLEPDQKGLLDILLAWMYIICQVGNLGFNAAGTKFFPHFRNDAQKHNGYIFLGIAISAIGLFITFAILFTFKDFFFSRKDGIEDLFNVYSFLLIPLSIATILFNIFDNYARSLYDSVFGTFLSQFLQRFLQMLSILAKAFGIIDFETFVWVWLIAICLPTLFMFFRVVKLGNFSMKPNFSIFTPELKKDFIQFSTYAVVSGLSGLIIQQLDKIMLHDYLGLEETAVYSTALFFNSVMGMSYVALIKTSAPIVIDAIKSEDFEKVETIYRKSCITQLAFGCLLYIGVWASIDRLFEFLPPVYSAGKNVILLIGFGKLFDLATGINGLILGFSKHYKIDAYLMISFVFILYLLNSYFIPNYKLIGAAIAAMIAVFYYNGFRTFLVWKYFKMQPFSIDNIKILALSAIVLIMAKAIPSIEGSKLLTLVDISIRSTFILITFVGGIYFMNVSAEINNVIKKGIGFFKI